MNYDLSQFRWSCPEQGYEWQGGLFLTIRFNAGKRLKEKHQGPALVATGESERTYIPEANLFLKFQRIGTDDDIREFANSYGLLGHSPPLLFPKARRKGIPTTGIRGELKSHWLDRLDKMKAAVSLWEALRKEDTQLLSQCIQWRGADRVDYQWPPSANQFTPWATHTTIASKQVNPHLMGRIKMGDVVMPARLYLQEVVNQNLRNLVSANLLWTIHDRKKMGLFIVPGSLIGCLWLQLASAIAEFRKFQNCEGCGRPMLVAPEGTGYRTNRKTCSGACRVKVYARRKVEARRLRSEGVSVREIAKRLDTGVEQIQRWIAES